jgi:hypothetical protein
MSEPEGILGEVLYKVLPSSLDVIPRGSDNAHWSWLRDRSGGGNDQSGRGKDRKKRTNVLHGDRYENV